MQRYVWTINGKSMEDEDLIRIGYGKRVRITFVNESTMAHAMQLHCSLCNWTTGRCC